jgi:hypothetical protein
MKETQIQTESEMWTCYCYDRTSATLLGLKSGKDQFYLLGGWGDRVNKDFIVGMMRNLGLQC